MILTPLFQVLVGIFGSATIGIFGWVFQRSFTLGNRVTILEARQESLPTLINSKFDEVNRRLARIEDAMNGHFNHEN